MSVLDIEPRKILVVDDDPDIRDALTSVLESEGYFVETASDGDEALERLPLNGDYVVLLDLMMPRLDGRAFLEEARKRFDSRSLPVVVMTAAGVRHVPGANRVLLKPFSVEEIFNALETSCDVAN